MKKLGLACAIGALALGLSACGGSSSDDNGNHGSGGTMTKAKLGRLLFMDESLSSQGTQACASCHEPSRAFTDPDVNVRGPVSEGDDEGHFGSRNAPTAAYAAFIPPFRLATDFGKSPETDTDNNPLRSKYEGGQFLDGRRPNLKEQAKDPFLNPVEMNNGTAANVVEKVRKGEHAEDFKKVFGDDIFSQDTDTVYDKIAEAIATFEKTDEVSPFSSKFDAVQAGTEDFTPSEQRGFDLFKDKAKCANCHSVDPNPEFGGKILFTNFKYYNVGTPPNPNNPANQQDSNFVDGGLGESLENHGDQYAVNIDSSDYTNELGKFRVPTLRNVELTSPYMHNGVYETLRDVINHYDTVVVSAGQSVNNYPEVDTNIAAELKFGAEDNNGDPLSNALDLSEEEMNDLEAFLKTLTDRDFRK